MEQNNLGTARWLSPETVAEMHPYSEGRIWAGRRPVPNDAYASQGDAIGLKDDRHILVVGGNRSGKGTTFIVPNLCLWPGSVLVLDPKGENAMLTAARRGEGGIDERTGATVEGMGQRTFVLDPFEQARGMASAYRARFNPLAELLDSETDKPVSDVLDQVTLIVDAIVVENDAGNADPYWNNAAKDVLRAIILHVLTDDSYAGYRNLVTVRRLLTLGDTEMLQWLKDKGAEHNRTAEELLWMGIAGNPAFGGIISGIGNRFLADYRNSYKTYAGVVSNAHVHTAFMDSDGLRESLRESDFALADLKTDKNGISIYLCLPQRYMQTHYRWMRIVTNLATAEMERTAHQPKSGHRVLFMLDEFAVLRRLESVETAVSYIAGFGVKMAFILQSLDQLKKIYPNAWETFYANCALRIFMGVEDNFTREYASKAVGDTEIVLYNRTRSKTDTKSRTTQQGGSRTRTTGNTKGGSKGGSKGRGRGGGESFTQNEGWNTGNSTTSGQGKSQKVEKRDILLRMLGFSKYQINDDEMTISSNGSQTSSNGRSGGTARGRNTSWNENEGENWSQNESVTLSEALGETWSVSESVSEAMSEGVNEARQKRPLIAPDEIGRYFARLDNKTHPAYPGLGLMLLSGEFPASVRRTNYFEDLRFDGLFTPHLDHEFAPRLLPPPVVETVAPEPVKTGMPIGLKVLLQALWLGLISAVGLCAYCWLIIKFGVTLDVGLQSWAAYDIALGAHCLVIGLIWFFALGGRRRPLVMATVMLLYIGLFFYYPPSFLWDRWNKNLVTSHVIAFLTGSFMFKTELLKFWPLLIAVTTAVWFVVLMRQRRSPQGY